MIDDLAMNAYLSGYIAALRNRHQAGAAVPENPYKASPSQRAGWLEGYKDATEEFGGLPTRQSTSQVPAASNSRD